MIVVRMASIKARSKKLFAVIASLADQTVRPDKIVIYCNDWEVMNNLDQHRFEYLPHPEGDLGDLGKFYEISDGFNLFVDDDILYPRNYVETLTNKCAMLGYPVGVHAMVIRKKVRNYFKDRDVSAFHEALPLDTRVNALGTGTLCFKKGQIDFDRTGLLPNMSDCHFAVAAQKQQVPLVAVKRPAGWLVSLGYKDCLYRNRGAGEQQTKVINQIEDWGVF